MIGKTKAKGKLRIRRHFQKSASLTLQSVRIAYTCIIRGATENAGVDRRGGKCRSRLAVWKAEPRLYSETALSYMYF